MSRFILASASPRRIQLFQAAGFDPEIIPASIEERDCTYLTPTELTLFNAFQKASNVAARFSDRLVLGADTVVALGSQVFGKPHDLEEARWMLHLLIGRTHKVVTGVVVIHSHSGRVIAEAVHTAVTFRTLSEPQIEEYLKIAEPLDKAGAYAAQNSPDLIIQNVEGSFTNVVGLPIEIVTSIFAELGIHPNIKERNDSQPMP